MLFPFSLRALHGLRSIGDIDDRSVCFGLSFIELPFIVIIVLVVVMSRCTLIPTRGIPTSHRVTTPLCGLNEDLDLPPPTIITRSPLPGVVRNYSCLDLLSPQLFPLRKSDHVVRRSPIEPPNDDKPCQCQTCQAGRSLFTESGNRLDSFRQLLQGWVYSCRIMDVGFPFLPRSSPFPPFSPRMQAGPI